MSKHWERAKDLARLVLKEQAKGNTAKAIDLVYELTHTLNNGDPVSSFLVTSKKLLEAGFPDVQSLLNYAKLAGYGGVSEQVAFQNNDTVFYPAVRGTPNKVRNLLNLVNPGIAIAAIELLRRGREAIPEYVKLLGENYSLVLRVARVLAATGYIEDAVDEDYIPDEVVLDEDTLVLIGLLGENYPLARKLLGGLPVTIPAQIHRQHAKLTPSVLISAAISEAVDRYLQDAGRGTPDSQEAVLDRISKLLEIAKRRVVLADKVRGAEDVKQSIDKR